MIKKPEGILKTVDYDGQSLFVMRHNTETENYPKHRHGATEIIMPLTGGYGVIINEDSYRLKEFDILIVPNGDIHEIQAPKSGGECIILQFDLTLLKSVKGLAGASFIFFKPWLITPNSPNLAELHGTLKVLLLEALEEYKEKQDYYEANITAKIITAAVFMARKQREELPEAFSDQLMKRRVHIVNFNRCIEYINQHYREDLPLEFVAKIAGFSKFHFTRWFKQFAGVSFYEYLTQVRIRVAESMLANTEVPITEIALESGFQSIATFNRVFKHNKKLTPTEYRNEEQSVMNK
ncbi:MAG: AraC family transcriptional regulator [Oscillospiraceae bacterium]|jgi:AraC-like DNA-binding protein|nr:AraC family transcriptional regulator [Oscillospiraceae bacterium]